MKIESMRELENDEEAASGQRAGFSRDHSPEREYEPLFSHWDDSSGTHRPLEDDLDPWSPQLSAHGHSPRDAHADDLTGWEPADARGQFYPETRTPAETPPWYRPDYGRSYEQAVTEAQRILREGTITIPRKERRWVVTVREVVETVLLALLIFLAVRASFQNFRVEGASMYPSLEDGEYLIVNKLSYAELDTSIFNFLPFYDSGGDSVKHLWGSPARGDVIVFRAPTSPNRDFIKRIIGTPGDKVEIAGDGKVSVNGTALTEPYIAGTTSCNGPQCTWDIPAAGSQAARDKCSSSACYFVMGDNRQNSSDSRQGWLVPEENIVGKALITYWHKGGPELDLAPNHSVAADEPGR